MLYTEKCLYFAGPFSPFQATTGLADVEMSHTHVNKRDGSREGSTHLHTLTVYHGDGAVFNYLTGHAGRLHLDGHQVPLMRHQHHDVKQRFFFLQLSGELNFLSVHLPALNAVPVKVRIRRDPRTGNGCGVLRPAMQVLYLVRL